MNLDDVCSSLARRRAAGIVSLKLLLRLQGLGAQALGADGGLPDPGLLGPELG